MDPDCTLSTLFTKFILGQDGKNKDQFAAVFLTRLFSEKTRGIASLGVVVVGVEQKC